MGSDGIIKEVEVAMKRKRAGLIALLSVVFCQGVWGQSHTG